MHIGHPVTRLVFALAGCLLLTPGVRGAQNQSVHVNDANGPLERCDQLDISFDGRSALRDEETLQLPVGNEPLQISSDHGGVALRSGTANQHEITLCKAVPDGAGADLPAIRAHVNGARVEVTGPAGRGWVGYLLVRSPRGSGVGLSTTNGPVRAESFEGHLTVKSTNGPISLALVTGNVAARAENGPIKVDGGGGDVSVETQNGPIRRATRSAPSGRRVSSSRGPRTVRCRFRCRRNTTPASISNPPVTRRGRASKAAAPATMGQACGGLTSATAPPA